MFSSFNSFTSNLKISPIVQIKSSYRYFKWVITRNQGNDTGGIQASEFNLILNGTKLSNSITTVTSPDSQNNSGEIPQNLVDGSTTSKCYTPTTTVTFLFDYHKNIQTNAFNAYSYTTANDVSSRNPSFFTLSASSDNVNFFLLDTRTNAVNTQLLFTEFAFNLAP
jgi:hypothetical protein